MRHIETNERAGRKEWIGLVTLILAVLLVSMDITVLYFAQPSISADLRPSGAQQLWMIDIYGFVLAGLLITMGGVGDWIGRRKLLLLGAGLFALASTAAAFAVSPDMLIAARAVQGVGGATLAPSTLGLIRNMFHDQAQRRKAIAAWSVGMSGGSALGPVLAGLLLNDFWWGAVFLVNVPVAILLLITSPILVPEYKAGSASRFDLGSAALSLAGILPLVWGLKEFANAGASASSVAAVLLGLLLCAVFLRRQRSRTDPMVDLRLFAQRGFGPAVAVNLVCYFVMVGFGIFTTQYLMEVLRMSPLEAALWTLVSPLAIGIFAPLATHLVHRVRPVVIIVCAFCVTAGGTVMMTQLSLARQLPLVIAGATMIAVGIAIAGTLVTDIIVGSAPAERSGRVSALLETAQQLGGAFGIAILGSIGASIYGGVMSRTLPNGLPADALSASGQTLGGAHEYANTLPKSLGDAVFHTAQSAFVDSMRPVALVACAVALFGAALAGTRLRHLRAGQTSQPVKSPSRELRSA